MRFSKLVLGAGLLAICAPLAAQGVISGDELNEREWRNSRGELAQNPSEQKKQFEFARVFGQCAYKANPDRAHLALDQAVPGKAERRLDFEDYSKRVAFCTPVRTLIDGDLMKAGIAEASIVDAENAKEIPVGGDVEKAGEFLKTVQVSRVDESDPFVMHQLAAECRVAMAPYPARALLGTEPGSEGEAAALTGWKQVTSGCDSLLDGVEPLSPYFERAYAALALYYWIDFAA